MPASTPYQTFGSTTMNPMNRAPTMCRILTLFLSTCMYEPLAPMSDFRTLLKSSLSMMTTSTWDAAIANAGAALNMNLAAEIAMKMAAPSQTTMKMYDAVACFGILVMAHMRPMRDMKNVTIPNPMATSLNKGAFASAIVEYSLLLTKYPWPLRIAWARDGSAALIAITATTRMETIAGSVRVHGKSLEITNINPRKIAARKRYTGTSNRTGIRGCS